MSNITGIIANPPIIINTDNGTRMPAIERRSEPVDSQQSEIKKTASVKRNVQLEEKIRQINEDISGENKKVEYEVHEKTNTLIFKVYDKNTGDLIKEFPSEKVLDMAVAIWEKYGLIIDKKV